jgi:MOSC domain-containing protein YiiM
VMDIQQDGLRKALKPDWRAGVSCRVLAGGKIKVGDAVRLRRS